jgi:hypothetical protein
MSNRRLPKRSGEGARSRKKQQAERRTREVKQKSFRVISTRVGVIHETAQVAGRVKYM